MLTAISQACASNRIASIIGYVHGNIIIIIIIIILIIKTIRCRRSDFLIIYTDDVMTS